MNSPTPLDPTWIKNPSAAVCLLNHLGLVRISGADTKQFLSNLLSCKMDEQTEHLQFCTVCNPKGRVISHFSIFYKEADIYLQMPLQLVTHLIDHLKKYVLMSKVVISDASSELTGIGYIAKPPTNLPEATSLLRVVGRHERYIAYTTAEQVAQLLRTAKESGYTVMDYHAWHYCDVADAIPNIYLSTSAQFTPQMINLDLLGAISFSKGCYPGQEVIARTHYLGKLKRRAYLFAAQSNDIEVGIPIYTTGEDEPCGLVIDCCNTTEQHSLIFASIKIRALNTSLYLKQGEREVSLKVVEMPYSVKEESCDLDS